MTIGQHARQWLREPLVHFLLAGFAVFLLYAVRGGAVDPSSRTITITTDQVQRLTQSWAQTWQRPPTPAEIDELIREYIKEEVYNREARRLGLDIDDTVIRRRLQSKMEFLAGAELENTQPGDKTLQAWLDRNPGKYAADAIYSFDQIYIKVDDENAGRARASALLTRLQQGGDWHGLGDAISLPPSLDKADRGTVDRDFGQEFGEALSGLKPGTWTGPVASGFGLHLVRLRSMTTSGKPVLATIRQQVENDWRAATLKEREAKAYQALLDGYTIKIAKP